MTSQNKSSNQKFQWTAEEGQTPERALVLVPELRETYLRSRQSRLEEAVGLAEAIALNVVHAGIVTVNVIRPGTFFGTGKIDEYAGLIKSEKIGLVIVDHTISPKQQQNLEKEWNCKVLDRTGIILEIFAERAQTKEGALQVELAHLNYQKGRLVRSWTHLERQRGGLGFVGGPGETQIEADRRLIQERINRLERDLEKVRRTRTLHRSKRQKVPRPVIALVGYTNAGKSTLFNRVTDAAVLAKDLLFATLDPTLRQLELPKGTKVILSDTVGFVSNLPTHLVAAFRATLEEVIEADLIVHVRDISHEDTQAQAEDVYSVLDQLGVTDENRARIIEVWNKVDLLSEEERDALASRNSSENKPILVSAISGQGIEDLLMRIEDTISDPDDVVTLRLPPSELGRLSHLYQEAKVLDRRDLKDGAVELYVRASEPLRHEMARFLVASD